MLKVINGGGQSGELTVRTWANHGRVVIDYTMGDRYNMSPPAARRFAAALLMAAEMAEPLPPAKPGGSNPTS